MPLQNWLKTLPIDFAHRSSRRDRRKTRLASGQVVLVREDFVCNPMVETLETRKLLSVDPVPVADLVPGAEGSNPTQFVNLNGTLFFHANDGTNGYEFWQSDGTAAGTKLVKDINAGSNSSPGSLTSVNGMLFFSANGSTNDHELWLAAPRVMIGARSKKCLHSVGPTRCCSINLICGIAEISSRRDVKKTTPLGLRSRMKWCGGCDEWH